MSKFDFFVILAGMRTGSNFLESNINMFDDLHCHGEAFNPYIMGSEGQSEILGVRQEDRDKNPLDLLDAIQAAPGINGFRYFQEHDPRILDIALADERCAKILLTRNPLEAYVSWRIARQTNQWKLTSATSCIPGEIEFKPDQFLTFWQRQQDFQSNILRQTQQTGQGVFPIAYEDLQNIATINGLARYLGSKHQVKGLFKHLKKQNPGSVLDKVVNPSQMKTALSKIDFFDIHKAPHFEPRWPASIPSYIAAAKSPLLYLPIEDKPSRAIEQWLARVDGVNRRSLERSFTQKKLRDWVTKNPSYRSFCVVRHPVARAYRAFCDCIVPPDREKYREIRYRLRRWYEIGLPEGELPGDWSAKQHRDAFEVFLYFLKGNLNGQSGIRVDRAWTSQIEIIKGFSTFSPPSLIIREANLDKELTHLCDTLQINPPAYNPEKYRDPIPLAQIYDADLEEMVRGIYARDYQHLGFAPWNDRSDA